MTTSGVTNGTLVASDLITRAMRKLGVLAAGETPTAEEYQEGIASLNWMMKSWQSRGVVSWRDTDGSVLFPANVSLVVLSPFCLDVMSARAVTAASPYTIERPLQRWERAQYRQLPNKTTPGTPTAYTVVKTAGTISMAVWPVPVVDTTINYAYARVIEDVTDGSQTIDVPQDWLEVAYLGLALELAEGLGVVRSDPNTFAAIQKRAAAVEQLLLDQDRPASIYMGSALGSPF